MKGYRIIIPILFLLALLLPAQGVFAADDEGYYIRDYHVEVVANPDRSYDVTETIDVWFDEYSHGIYRFMPTKSTVESYTINDFRAVGDPFIVEYDGTLRIGDPDIELKGQKTYTIKYTLEHFADTVPDADYFYMNLIGTEWDVRIESFSARVTLPENAVVEEYTLTGGGYGSKEGADLADVTVSGNVITIEGRGMLNPRNGITLNVRMPEGTFYEAEVWIPAFEVERLDILVNIDEYGLITVEEKYRAKVNKSRAFFRSISDYQGGYYWDTVPYRVLSINSTGPDGRTVNESISVDLYDYVGEVVDFSFNYSMQSKMRESVYGAGFYLRLVSGYEELRIDKLNLEVNGPFEITGLVAALYGGDGVLAEPSFDGKRLTAHSIEPLYSQDVNYIVEFERGTFIRKLTVLDFALPILLAFAALLGLHRAFARNREKPVVPVVEFYPPLGMSPAEVGYIIDQAVSSRDVTSLIYYWASHGHLNIEIIDNKNFKLHILTDLDELHPEYERVMFTDLWKLGENLVVSNEDLKDKFYRSVRTAASGVRGLFSGERALFQEGRKPASLLVGIIMIPVFILMLYIANRFWYFAEDLAIATGMLFAFAWFVLGLVDSYRNSRYKSRGAGRIRLTIGIILTVLGVIVFAGAFGDGVLVLTISALISGIALFLFLISVPFWERRSDYYTHILGLCQGFQMFLRTAEKDRLEMLLEQDPDYYYNILPYAQVLGVTKIWEKKFDGMLSQPPSWCYGAGVDTYSFNSRTMSSMMGTMSTNMTSSPSSDSGGGGFSGGGSSGGGSGGGGGGRW